MINSAQQISGHNLLILLDFTIKKLALELLISDVMNPLSKAWWKRTSNRRPVLLTVLFLEILAATWFWQRESQKNASKAFLTKLNGNFVMAWKDEVGEINVVQRSSLKEMLEFSHNELGLSLGRNLGPEANLEKVWKSDRLGGYVVHWKSETDETLNQMTFYSNSEAEYFLRAFRSGSYSRSILGHSILFVATAIR